MSILTDIGTKVGSKIKATNDRVTTLENAPNNGGANYTTFSSNVASNILNANTWNVISATTVSVTAIGTNSKYIYTASLSYESDITAGDTNGFLMLQYSVNGGSNYTNILESTANFITSDAATTGGTGSTSFIFPYQSTLNVSNTIIFRMVCSKNNSLSIYFNQPSLGGQPAGTSNHCSGYVIEI